MHGKTLLNQYGNADPIAHNSYNSFKCSSFLTLYSRHMYYICYDEIISKYSKTIGFLEIIIAITKHLNMENLSLERTIGTNGSLYETDFDLLFDSSYWEKQEIFSSYGNEKYIRDYTISEHYDAEKSEYSLYYKIGGLITESNCCWYKEGYIKPTDVLFYRDNNSAQEIKTINFNDLIVCAIMHKESDYVATMSFSIVFISISTGDFFQISYDYSVVYVADEYASEEDLLYYACKVELTEKDLLLLSSNDDWTLYNTGEYISLRRSHKIKTAVFG
ncbi:hypothetical protein FVR03_20175 [Pontibacter qinzhouensis]|uniref:Uncharacterized protein n=1 Tax=Pontibacter qinzhouensis TaxID=2603253 RepID=A0A5C8J4U4_9BACT|nr:hypothetical protein [Pontibacter qinzhouensis]TXK30860.1 hypothetical protein FVR03_20175 [Pontibacter qinzhouensis]